MPGTGARLRGLAPLIILATAVVFTAFGLAQGLWLENIHNALLAVTFTFVGAYVLFQRPRHREGLLFLATGAVHAVMFLGRQIGHFAPGESPVWGWLGVWPLAPALALTTLSVICFPDGRLPSRYWRPVVIGVGAIALVIAIGAAVWPVNYASAGVVMAHPFTSTTPDLIDVVWPIVAYPSFVGFQLLWVVALVDRWRHRTGVVRRQVGWLVVAAAVSAGLLIVGLLVWGTPRAGILAATLLPLAAGWAIVHGQHAVAYSALSWLSRAADPREFPDAMARGIRDALSARQVVVWLGDSRGLNPVGTWPEADTDPPLSTFDALSRDPTRHVQPVRRGDVTLGAITVDRNEPFSRSEARLFEDLGSQAVLVLDHLTLADVIEQQGRAGATADLTHRESEVLALIARGLSNAAICDELHLSIKTVEPIVGTIFTKLGLHSDSRSNRRVLAALEYQRSARARFPA